MPNQPVDRAWINELKQALDEGDYKQASAVRAEVLISMAAEKVANGEDPSYELRWAKFHTSLAELWPRL